MAELVLKIVVPEGVKAEDEHLNLLFRLDPFRDDDF